jgi:hypothetical protein
MAILLIMAAETDKLEARSGASRMPAGSRPALTTFAPPLFNFRRLTGEAMRRAVTPAIPPKLYRHFALVTVAITAGLAMFADGEKREVISSHIEAKQQADAVRRASYAKFGAPRLGQSSTQPAARFADERSNDFDGGFGRPMENPHGGRSSSVVPGQELAEAAGYSPEYVASLSPEELELLIKGLQESGMLSDESRSQAQANLTAASARRSGAPGTTS